MRSKIYGQFCRLYSWLLIFEGRTILCVTSQLQRVSKQRTRLKITDSTRGCKGSNFRCPSSVWFRWRSIMSQGLRGTNGRGVHVERIVGHANSGQNKSP